MFSSSHVAMREARGILKQLAAFRLLTAEVIEDRWTKVLANPRPGQVTQQMEKFVLVAKTRRGVDASGASSASAGGQTPAVGTVSLEAPVKRLRGAPARGDVVIHSLGHATLHQVVGHIADRLYTVGAQDWGSSASLKDAVHTAAVDMGLCPDLVLDVRCFKDPRSNLIRLIFYIYVVIFASTQFRVPLDD
jgi:hypothetical protein